MQTELDKVVAALKEFYASEAYLLEQDLGERTLTHRLAVYVEKQFPGWQVDCNYDRLGERMLRMPHGTIISTDDLLAIEVRKASNHQPLEHDQHKLAGLTDPHVWFAYWIGVLLTLAKTEIASSEVYAGGVVDHPNSLWFAERLKQAALDKG